MAATKRPVPRFRPEPVAPTQDEVLLFLRCHFFLPFLFVAVFGLSRRPRVRASGKTAAFAACLEGACFGRCHRPTGSPRLSPGSCGPPPLSGAFRVPAAPFRGAFRHSAASFVPRAGESGCCAVVKVRAACLAKARACLPLVAAWLSSLPFAAALVRRRPSCRRRGACASLLVRVVGACRPACAGGPIWLVRGGLRRRGACGGPAAVVRASGGVSASRSSLWHHDTTFFGVCPTSKALTISLLFCACTTKVKISKWLFCCFSVPCGARI